MENYLRKFAVKDGILIFDQNLDENLSTYDSHHLDSIQDAESFHFWFSSRKDKVIQAFMKFVNKNDRILEVGGGTGYIAHHLQQKGYKVEVSDAASNGLLHAKKKGIHKLYQFDLYHPPFEEAFDVICLFDVLEHLDDEKRALNQMKSLLKPGGKIILTVPAHQWLWSLDDTIAGHKKRYTKKTLTKAFKLSNLTPIQTRYFFKFILPFLFLRTWLRRDKKMDENVSKQLNFTLPLWLNSFFGILTKLELKIDRFLPNIAGGSLLAIAKKD